MSEIGKKVQNLVRSGCTFRELIDYLRTMEEYNLTSVGFLMLLSDACGIPWTRTRDEIYASVDVNFNPVESETDIEFKWKALVNEFSPH